MKREEHYCDRCGTQMTSQDHDGDSCYGIQVLAQRPTEAHTIEAGVVVDISMKQQYGSSSSRKLLHGREFCSFTCFEASMLTLIEKVKEVAP